MVMGSVQAFLSHNRSYRSNSRVVRLPSIGLNTNHIFKGSVKLEVKREVQSVDFTRDIKLFFAVKISINPFSLKNIENGVSISMGTVNNLYSGSVERVAVMEMFIEK